MRYSRVNVLFACLVLFTCVCSSAAAASEKKDKKKDEQVSWPSRVVPGPAVTLRVKRAVGKYLIYDGSMERAQISENSYNEQSEFYLNALCADHAEGLDLMAVQRTYTKRDRTERYKGGREIKNLRENTSELVDLGENFTLVGTLRCYPYDAQNRVAYRSEQVLTLRDGQQSRGSVLSRDKDKLVFLTSEDKLEFNARDVADVSIIPLPHILLNDTQHYLFPIFPERAVAPGDTWKFKVPVIIPLRQGNPPRVWPTQFSASLLGRLREVKQEGASRIAVIDYKVNGVFDSKDEEFKGRFPANFDESNHVVHSVAGDGTVHLDLEKGRIANKTESFKFRLYASSMVTQGADKPAKLEENKADVQSTFRVRLMLPGEKLKSGIAIPEYD